MNYALNVGEKSWRAEEGLIVFNNISANSAAYTHRRKGYLVALLTPYLPNDHRGYLHMEEDTQQTTPRT